MQYSDAVAQALIDQDVEVLFGLAGDANMYWCSAFTRRAGREFVAVNHEGSSVLMAAGYAAVTGRVGVATVTHGALTNCVTALFDVVRGRYPVVLLAGDTDPADRLNLQNLPHADIVRPTGAAFCPALSPESVFADVSRAFHLARVDERAVVLNIPANLQRSTVELPRPVPIAAWTSTVEPDTDALETAVAMISACNRPVVLAGRGVKQPEGEAAVLALARRIGAPLATTLRDKGLFESDPWNLGLFGSLSHEIASGTIAKADCVVTFGASLSGLTTLRGELTRGKRVIHVDRDPAALGRYCEIAAGVAGDAGPSASQMCTLLDIAEVQPRSGRSAELASALERYRTDETNARSTIGPLDIHDAVHRINEILPADRILTIDVGRFAHVAHPAVRVSDRTHYVHALNVAQIGLSFAYGLGGSIGRPDAWTAIVGDGGFMLGGIGEFTTAVRRNAKLIVFVMNDQAYGAEYYRLARNFHGDLVEDRFGGGSPVAG